MHLSSEPAILILVRIEPVQQCRSRDGWAPIQIASHTEEGLTYTVLTNPWNEWEEFACDCEGYRFRGHCRHQKEAFKAMCGWHELESFPEKQTEEQRHEKVCPRCYGPTMWVMEAIDEGD